MKKSIEIMDRFSKKRQQLPVLISLAMLLIITVRNCYTNRPVTGTLDHHAGYGNIVLFSISIFLILFLVQKEIKQKKQITEELKIQKEHFKVIVNSLSEGLVTTNKAGEVVYMNPVAEQLTGWRHTEAAGLPLEKIYVVVNEETGKPFENIVSRILKERKAVEFENNTILYSRNGETKIISNSGLPLLNANGEISGAVLVFNNITERKKEQEEIQKLSLIVRKTANAVLITDTEEKIQWVNAAFTHITEYTLEEIIGKRPGDILQGPDSDVHTIRYMHNKISQHRGFECDILNYSKSGKKIWLRIHCQPQFDNKGNTTGFFAVQTDITKEKNAEMALQASEKRYRHLFDMNPSSIIIWDLDTMQILESNQKASEEYGYPKKELLQKNILELKTAKNHDEFRSYAEKLNNTETGTVTTRVWELITKSGEPIYMNIAAHKIQYNGKNLVMAIGNNVTENVMLYDKLEKERIAKQQAITEAVITAQENERKEIGSELHDNINQVLASARLYLGLAQQASEKTDTYIEKADQLINSATIEIRNLCHSLNPPVLHESGLIDSLKQLTDTITKTTNIRIQTQVTDFDEQQVSDTFKLGLFRISQELFTNILKHAKASRVVFKLYRQNHFIILDIKDDGIGFDTKKIKAGLGLLNIRTRASLFNGKMAITSSPGNGVDFKIVFDPHHKYA